ncbi:PTS transporter subunit IIC [Escherichia coli]
MAGVVIHAAFVYKLGDWFARDTRNFFELEGIAIPHGTSAYMGPIAVLVDAIIEKSGALTELNLAPRYSAQIWSIWRACHRGFL